MKPKDFIYQIQRIVLFLVQ